jgi:anti-sigma factor RsiW
MQCEELRRQIADYLTDDLDQSQQSEIHRHLLSCKACRQEVEALRATWSQLGAVSIDVPDSRAMRKRFDLMLDVYRQGMNHSASRSGWAVINGWFERWLPAQPAVQFAIGVMLLAGGVALGRLAVTSEPTVQTTDINDLRSELRDMRQMVALSLMQQQSATERLRGVSWTRQIDQPDAQVETALLDALMHDANVNVRLAAIDALKRFGQSKVVRDGTVRALEQADSPLVQVALIDLMVELQEKESSPSLRRLAQDANTDLSVRGRAEWGLRQLE